jgi:hypothetical protein
MDVNTYLKWVLAIIWIIMSSFLLIPWIISEISYKLNKRNKKNE